MMLTSTTWKIAPGYSPKQDHFYLAKNDRIIACWSSSQVLTPDVWYAKSIRQDGQRQQLGMFLTETAARKAVLEWAGNPRLTS